MVAARWRQMRLWSVESANLQLELDTQAEANAHHSSTTRAALVYRTLSDQTGTLDRFNRYETRFDRQFSRALSRLLELRAAQKKQILPIEPNLL